MITEEKRLQLMQQTTHRYERALGDLQWALRMVYKRLRAEGLVGPVDGHDRDDAVVGHFVIFPNAHLHVLHATVDQIGRQHTLTFAPGPALSAPPFVHNLFHYKSEAFALTMRANAQPDKWVGFMALELKNYITRCFEYVMYVPMPLPGLTQEYVNLMRAICQEFCYYNRWNDYIVTLITPEGPFCVMLYTNLCMVKPPDHFLKQGFHPASFDLYFQHLEENQRAIKKIRQIIRRYGDAYPQEQKTMVNFDTGDLQNMITGCHPCPLNIINSINDHFPTFNNRNCQRGTVSVNDDECPEGSSGLCIWNIRYIDEKPPGAAVFIYAFKKANDNTGIRVRCFAENTSAFMHDFVFEVPPHFMDYERDVLINMFTKYLCGAVPRALETVFDAQEKILGQIHV